MAPHLQEAQKVVGLGGVSADNRRLADRGGQGSALAQGAVLDGGREERRRGDLLPEIEARESKSQIVRGGRVCGGYLRGLIPVARDVIEVELDDGPEGGRDPGAVSVGDQPVGVVDYRRGAQSRSV